MEKSEWYNNEILVDLLLFLIFPIGLYAVYKTDKIKMNATKIIYSSIGFISYLIVIVTLIKG
ncbi:hypothetical protein [Salibacter sp.]|uniref:hypothetical protein n=1 Tax=Salibacter sp. TaxID=2010995 RepID=UPI0028701FA2|nr:hypothetical protein [Salibacter sp.]MDR9487217.1 hypothetical protein [Salibacter sp.]